MTDITPEQPSDDIAKLLGRATELGERVNSLAAEDKEGRAEAQANFSEIKAQINDLQKAEDTRLADVERKTILADLEALKESTRRPSKADDIRRQPNMAGPSEEHFFATLAMARSQSLSGSVKASLEAEERLASMGAFWSDVPSESKATVGGSNAAGGYLVPAPVVSAINYQATPGRAVVDLFQTVNDVRGTGVAIPFEDANSVYSRAIIAGAGTLKENSNFITNSYTATLYTLARIYDVGNQLLRQSEGAAEQLVRNALGRAFALGEDYYAISGSGSSEPYGLLTALGTGGPYVTTFSSPSVSTIAGNWATCLAGLAGAVANRGAIPDCGHHELGRLLDGHRVRCRRCRVLRRPLGRRVQLQRRWRRPDQCRTVGPAAPPHAERALGHGRRGRVQHHVVLQGPVLPRRRLLGGGHPLGLQPDRVPR